MALTTGITQLRFYNDKSPQNTPYSEHTSYCEPTVFSKYAPISQFGIQTLPGTRFFVNQNTDPIIVGASGIYEMDLRNTTAVVSSIYFSLESMERINNSEDGYLIIDLIHSGNLGGS